MSAAAPSDREGPAPDPLEDAGAADGPRTGEPGGALPDFLAWDPASAAAAPARAPDASRGSGLPPLGVDAAAPAADGLAAGTPRPPPFPPLSPAPAALPAETEAADAGDSRSLLSALRDNVEAVAFALILALLLRHCAIEVFKIPTASMEPTLFGDNSETHPDTPGDRILVDKSAYLLHRPERWDVVVFHYPLDWSRNFIKRVIFLAGEAGRIERGDPWAGTNSGAAEPRLHPARKPRNVREELYVHVYPPVGSAATGSPSNWWRAIEGGPGRWQVEEHGRLVYEGDGPDADRLPGLSSREYGYSVRDGDRSDREPGRSMNEYFLVPDVRLRCRVTADAPAEVELSWSPGDGRRHALRIASAGRAPSAAFTNGVTKTLPRTLVPGRPSDLELESVDGDLRAWVDGDEVAVISDEIPIEDAVRLERPGEGETPQSLRVSARGGRVVVDRVRVDHDLYYTNYHVDGNRPVAGETLHLGPDDYFMLGDNTRKSSDSRRWQASVVTLKDGTKIASDWQTQPHYVTVDGRSMKEVVDVEGVTRRWAVEDEADGISESVRMPFVKRDRIVGRAWFALVFSWRLDETLPRIRFIH